VPHDQAAAASGAVAKPVRYQRHRPDKTDLHRIIRENLDALESDEHESRLPSFVPKAFESYVACGLLSRGFIRFACDRCRTNAFVAFSCKVSLCPSCGARKTEDTTEHVMTRVLPDVAVRQWVLSIPFQLRARVAFDPGLFSAVVRIFVDEVFRHHERKARELSLLDVKSGAIAVLQRFGGTLATNPHAHVVALDGVFVRGGAAPSSDEDTVGLEFHAIGAPTPAEIHAVSEAVCRRVLRLLRRRGVADAEGLIPVEAPDPHQAVGEMSMRQWPLFAMVDPDGQVRPVHERNEWERAGDVRGFSLHASVSARQGDTEGRRRIVRYCVRPPLAEKQVRSTRDGRVSFELRHPRSNGATHVVFSEQGFVRRLAGLVPRPYHHAVRYFGLLSSSSPLRRLVVPTPEIDLHLHNETTAIPSFEPASAGNPRRGALWAILLRRVYGVDALACPKPGCDGRLRPVAAILNRSAIRKILDHTGLDDEPPPPRTRGPPLGLFLE
jgi:hypothetical protein